MKLIYFKMRDLFEDHENIPKNVQAILDKYDLDDVDYDQLSELVSNLEKNTGYTFDYDLDGVPYGLRPVGVSINQIDGYGDEEIEPFKNGGEALTDKQFFKKNLKVVIGSPDRYGEDVYGVVSKKEGHQYVVGGWWYVYNNLKSRGFSDKEATEMLREAEKDASVELFKNGGEIKSENTMSEELKRISRLLDNDMVKDPEMKAKLQARRDMLEEKAGSSKKETPKQKEKVAKVMGEFKKGKLTTHGKKVTKKKQAVAIALSEAGVSKNKKSGETVLEYAKRTRKSGETWNNAVKRASKELKNGGKPVAKKIKKTEKKSKPAPKKIKKVVKKAKPVAKKTIKKTVKSKKQSSPRVIKRVKYLNGSTTKGIDKTIKALAPGKRISKSGKTYYEYRANRADLNRTKKLEQGGEI